MALEAATTINQLVVTNPDGLDSKSQGDDHLRLLKRTIKQTFPNIAGVCNASHEDLNRLALVGSTASAGMVVIWPWSVASIPAGWKLCNGVGNISDGRAVPNMGGRMVMGHSASYPTQTTGGSATHTHTLSVSIHNFTLRTEHIPPHSHGVPIGRNDTTGTGWVQASPGNSNGANSPAYYTPTQSVGGGLPHTHGNTSSAASASSLPPYYAACYIIKD